MQDKSLKPWPASNYVERHDGQIYQTRARGNFRKEGHTPMLEIADFFCGGPEGYILKIRTKNSLSVHPLSLLTKRYH